MGFYFRKSKSFGLFRLNFSRSGIGVSVGVKGARLSMGTNENYVNIGRNGIYYRKKIGNSSYEKNAADIKQQPSPHISDYETDAIQLPSDSGNASQLSKNITKGIKRAKTFAWCWIALAIGLLVLIPWWSFIPIFFSGLVLSKLFYVVIKYDLDSEASLEWDKYSEILNLLKSSKKLWIIETAKWNSNTKYNAGASRNVSRSVVTVKKIKPNHNTEFRIKTDVPSVLMKSRKCSLLFLPSNVIMKKGMKYIAYSYNQMVAYFSTTDFIETNPVPRDAEIIRYTWQYVNKNGTADKRFTKNRRIPVCRYGCVHLNVGQELSIELHASNKLVAENVGNAHKLYKSFVNTICAPVVDSEENDIQSEMGENSASPFSPEKDGRLVPVAAGRVDIFNDDKGVPADNMGKSVNLDSLEKEKIDDNFNNDNRLIDDMSMFLEENENGDV